MRLMVRSQEQIKTIITIKNAGERAAIVLYNGKINDDLQKLRCDIFD